jgi:SRR1
MEDDAWTHVKSKRKNGSGKPKKQIIVSKNNPVVTNIKDSDEDCGTAEDVIANCTKLSGTLSLSPLLKCLLSELGRTNFTQFSTTIALGIGQFCSSQSSLLQLAMLLSIRSHQRRLSGDGNDNNSSSSSSDSAVINEDTNESKSNCMIFDPLLSSKEREVCSLLNCPVSPENPMGKHRIESGPTLFFMPHCPHRLYINLLWENWSQLNSVIILGNR